MDSDQEDNNRNEFANKGGEALNLDDGADFNDSEEEDDAEDDIGVPKKPSPPKGAGSGSQKDVKGEKLDNQPYDLAVDVNDSEEIESDEEEDEVNINDVQRSTAN